MDTSNGLAYRVDIDEVHKAELRANLMGKGFEPRFFTDGVRLIRYVNGDGAKFKPSLVLIDLLTPGIGPFDLARRLAERDWGDVVPIIIMAKTFGPEDRLEAQGAGAITCMGKPLDMKQVMWAVEERRRRNAESQAQVKKHFKGV